MSKLLVDAESIRELANILTETGLSEIEIADKDQRVRVVKNVGIQTVVSSVPATPVSTPVVEKTVSVSSKEEDLSKHPGAVTSPMIGIAYLRPEPSAPPFVTVGQKVEAGQTLMLIEAMKTFNQIRAPKAGKVTHILVSEGDPVEYGEVLVVVE